MLLAVDIGNTNTDIGIFQGKDIRIKWSLATSVSRTSDEYAVVLLTLMEQQNLKPSDIDKAAICSVTPPLIPTYRELCDKYFHIRTY